MSEADGKDGVRCEGCGGWVDYTDLGSVMHHEHRGLPEPWGVKGVPCAQMGTKLVPILEKAEHLCGKVTRSFIYARDVMIDTTPMADPLNKAYKQMKLYYCPVCKEEFGVWA